MTRYRVEFALEARTQADAIEIWWVGHRPAAPTMFREELAAAIRLLSESPFLGTEYVEAPVRGVRRILIGRSRHHVYWEVDPNQSVVTITAVWHAARGAGPPL